MKILITGTNGYVGGSLYRYFSSKYDVTALTRKQVDLTDSKAVNDYLSNKYYDVILHCAISGGHRLKQDDVSVLDDNLKMYYNIESNKKSFSRFINLGSGAEIYDQDKPYGKSKNVISQSIKCKDNFYNIRIFAVFDENELETRFIKTCITNYLNRHAITVHANKYMDFFYMKDLVNVVDYYMNDDPPFKEFNCRYTNHVTLTQIAEFINHLDDHKVPIILESSLPDKDYISTTNQKILGLEYIGLEAGILETYNNLKK